MSVNGKPKREANPCGKQVKPEEAYEVWQSYDGSWTYYVLKKYSIHESTFSRWYCAVSSPMTFGRLEYGDVYCGEVKTDTMKLDHNPLVAKENKDEGNHPRQSA